MRQFPLPHEQAGAHTMADTSAEPTVKGYHAHVYYDQATRPVAAQLRETISSKFAVEFGPFSDEPRGPHPVSQFNVIFKADQFQSIVPWLMLNHEGLAVLV